MRQHCYFTLNSSQQNYIILLVQAIDNIKIKMIKNIDEDGIKMLCPQYIEKNPKENRK